jgi:biopolymer transport protein ExbB/TolQ
MSGNAPTWILATQWASRLILFLLAGLSVWSVSIMVDRFRVLKEGESSLAADAARKLVEARDWSGLRDWANNQKPGTSAAVLAGTLKAMLASGVVGHDAIERSVRSYLALERSRLERGLTTLATLGSNAPFIGLFGTVLGIIQAFGSLASQQSNTSSVMTGISEALVATAIGLFVAIPAVVAYNILNRRLRVILVECESLRDLYLSRFAGG